MDPFIICFLTLVSAKMGTVICEYFLPFFSSQSQVLPSIDREAQIPAPEKVSSAKKEGTGGKDVVHSEGQGTSGGGGPEK